MSKSNLCASSFYLGGGLLDDSRVSSLKEKLDKLSRPKELLSDTSDILSCSIFITPLETPDFCLGGEKIFFWKTATFSSADSVVCFHMWSCSSILLCEVLSEPHVNIAETKPLGGLLLHADWHPCCPKSSAKEKSIKVLVIITGFIWCKNHYAQHRQNFYCTLFVHPVFFLLIFISYIQSINFTG